MRYLIFILAIFLTSCGKFQDGTSVWQGGLWIIPMATSIGFAIFAINGYRAWRSGWQQQVLGQGHKEGKEKLPWYKIPQWYFAAAFLVATILIIIYQNSQK